MQRKRIHIIYIYTKRKGKFFLPPQFQKFCTCPVICVAFWKIWHFLLGHFRRLIVLWVFVPFLPLDLCLYFIFGMVSCVFGSCDVFYCVSFLVSSHYLMHIVLIALPFSYLFLLYRYIYFDFFFLSYYTCLFGLFLRFRFLMFCFSGPFCP